METFNWGKPYLIIDNQISTVLLHYQKDVNKREIIVKKNSKAYIIELFEEQSTQNIETYFIVEENASLEYVKVQNGLGNSHFYYQFDLNENALMHMHNFELGTAITKHHFKATLDSNHTELYINGLVQAFNDTNCENHFDIVHEATNTLSQIEYKHSMHDISKALFQATTHVKNSAAFSQAYQNCNTLLLSDDATIFTQPHLLIDIDELQASHGATTGSLNEDELLYLQSRGIDEQTANEMLLKAFENEVYDKISHNEIKEYLDNYKRSKHE